jgi:hypothetical protein
MVETGASFPLGTERIAMCKASLSISKQLISQMMIMWSSFRTSIYDDQD